MKKFLMAIALCLMCAFSMTSCYSVTPDAEQEAVLIYQPWIWGHGGIDMEAVPTGLDWCWCTTDAKYFSIVPVRYDEEFDDIFSNDNTPLDFHTYINIQIKAGKSPILYKNYGENWYKNQIQVYYRNRTREYVSMYSPFDLISNREVINTIDSMLLVDMCDYVKTLSAVAEFPIVINAVTTGAARPNKDQLSEMNQTAAAIQKAKTQERLKEMYAIQEQAEKQRAKADKAYMSEMNLQTDQFIQLKYIEMIAAKDGANIDVMVGPATSMWNVRR